jgi:hypothetical protein
MKELIHGEQLYSLAEVRSRAVITDIKNNQSSDSIHQLPEIWGKVHHMAGYYNKCM